MRCETATRLTLGQLAAWGRARGDMPESLRALSVAGLNVDSRTIAPGEVFVALATERDDGHRYVAPALSAGARAAVIASDKLRLFGPELRGRLIVVDDPLSAVHRMATQYRRTLGIPFAGITGSSGKTTTRALIAATLGSSFTIGETAGNLNNHIGVPLSILRFSGKEKAGIIELGANHAGEIHTLSMITQPDLGIITNVGYAHVGLFGSLQATLAAKWEIVDGMGRGGVLVLNGDDRRLVGKARSSSLETVFFGFSARCDVRASDAVVTPDLHTHFVVDGQSYELCAPGRHLVYGALPAVVLGRRFGLSNGQIRDALRSFRPPAMRGGIEEKSGIRYIVDCYNANPSSMISALQLLKDVGGTGRLVAIVGDMLELGAAARRLHRDLGRRLAAQGVSEIVAVGQFAGVVADGAARAGMNAGRVHTAPDSESAVEKARVVLRPGDTVLLKASRGVRLETLYERLS